MSPTCDTEENEHVSRLLPPLILNLAEYSIFCEPAIAMDLHYDPKYHALAKAYYTSIKSNEWESSLSANLPLLTFNNFTDTFNQGIFAYDISQSECNTETPYSYSKLSAEIMNGEYYISLFIHWLFVISKYDNMYTMPTEVPASNIARCFETTHNIYGKPIIIKYSISFMNIYKLLHVSLRVSDQNIKSLSKSSQSPTLNAMLSLNLYKKSTLISGSLENRKKSSCVQLSHTSTAPELGIDITDNQNVYTPDTGNENENEFEQNVSSSLIVALSLIYALGLNNIDTDITMPISWWISLICGIFWISKLYHCNDRCKIILIWIFVTTTPTLYAQSNGDLRLMNGTEYGGRLEVYYNGQWGTVCDDFFDSSAGIVACRQMGYNFYVTEFDAIGGTDPIMLDDVRCTGSESKLVDCYHRVYGIHNCDHDEDVGLECLPGLFSHYVVDVTTEIYHLILMQHPPKHHVEQINGAIMQIYTQKSA